MPSLALADEARAGDCFITTKVWHDRLAPLALRDAFDRSLAQLDLGYVGLYMVHWPSPAMDMTATLEALTELRSEGLARAIGVCNFNLPMLHFANEQIGAPIAAVEVEYHPFLDQSVLLTYLRGKDIPLVAYAPLAQVRAAEDVVLQRIGAKHGASA